MFPCTCVCRMKRRSLIELRNLTTAPWRDILVLPPRRRSQFWSRSVLQCYLVPSCGAKYCEVDAESKSENTSWGSYDKFVWFSRLIHSYRLIMPAIASRHFSTSACCKMSTHRSSMNWSNQWVPCTITVLKTSCDWLASQIIGYIGDVSTFLHQAYDSATSIKQEQQAVQFKVQIVSRSESQPHFFFFSCCTISTIFVSFCTATCNSWERTREGLPAQSADYRGK